MNVIYFECLGKPSFGYQGAWNGRTFALEICRTFLLDMCSAFTSNPILFL